MSVKKRCICSKESTSPVIIIVRDSALIVFFSVPEDIQRQSFRRFFRLIVLRFIIGLMPGNHVAYVVCMSAKDEDVPPNSPKNTKNRLPCCVLPFLVSL